MWRPEARWGELVRELKDRAHVAANMIGRVADKEVCGLLRWNTAIDEDDEGTWGTHNLLRSSHVAVNATLGGSNRSSGYMLINISEHSWLHKMYIGWDQSFSSLWERFVNEEAANVVLRQGWGESDASRTAVQVEAGEQGWEFSAKALEGMHEAFYSWGRITHGLSIEQRLRTVPLAMEALSLKCIVLGTGNEAVSIKVGDWVLARPDDDCLSPIPDANESLPQFGVPKCMWFGRVLSMFKHKRQGLPAVEVVKAEWHASVGPYDTDFMAPVVRKGVVYPDDPYIPAQSLLPLKMVAMKHPRHAHLLVLLRKTWLPLSAVHLPVPWPSLAFYPPAAD